MKRINSSILLILFFAGVFIAGLTAFVFAQPASQSGTVDITGTVQGCGDNIIEAPEQCDGTDLGGETCISQGFTSGTLNCDASCNFDTSQCTSTPHGGTSHNECNAQKQCVSVSGSGTDQCHNDSDCYHNECNAQKQCVSVSGSGTDQCHNDSDCACDPHGDINKDGSINIVDFSILMYFWHQTPPSNPCVDLNKDGTVDLTDFSIMLYWWTG